MSSRTNSGPLAARTAHIVELLSPDRDEPDLARRVTTFLRLNNYGATERAARETATRLRAGRAIRDPWAYTVGLINGSHARASLLRDLIHWVEDGLRARVDLAFADAVGEDWFRSLDNYVPDRGLVPSQIGRDRFRSVIWVVDPRAPGGKRPDPDRYPGAEAFMADLAFGDLISIVRFACNDRTLRPSLGLAEVPCPHAGCDPFDGQGGGCCSSPHAHSTLRLLRMTPACKSKLATVPSGSTLPPSKVISMLKSVRDARNDVDHNIPLSTNLYREARKDATHLLVALGFDLARATRRVERRRLLVLDPILKGLGLSEGVQVLFLGDDRPAAPVDSSAGTDGIERDAIAPR